MLTTKEMESFEIDAHGNLWCKSWVDVVKTDTGETVTDGKRSALKERVTPDKDLTAASGKLRDLTDSIYDEDAIDQYYDNILNQPDAVLTEAQLARIESRRAAAKANRAARQRKEI